MLSFGFGVYSLQYCAHAEAIKNHAPVERSADEEPKGLVQPGPQLFWQQPVVHVRQQWAVEGHGESGELCTHRHQGQRLLRYEEGGARRYQGAVQEDVVPLAEVYPPRPRHVVLDHVGLAPGVVVADVEAGVPYLEEGYGEEDLSSHRIDIQLIGHSYICAHWLQSV
jgi:hypothetical protein